MLSKSVAKRRKLSQRNNRLKLTHSVQKLTLRPKAMPRLPKPPNKLRQSARRMSVRPLPIKKKLNVRKLSVKQLLIERRQSA